jgi:hypothetical protein
MPSYQDIETALISFGFNQIIHKSDKLPVSLPSKSNNSSSSVVIEEPTIPEQIIPEPISDIVVRKVIIESPNVAVTPSVEKYFDDEILAKIISATIINKIIKNTGRPCSYGDIREDLKGLGWFTGRYRTTPGRSGLSDISVFAPWCIERAPELTEVMKSANSNNNMKGEVKYPTMEKLIINFDYFPEGHTEALLKKLLVLYDFTNATKRSSSKFNKFISI